MVVPKSSTKQQHKKQNPSSAPPRSAAAAPAAATAVVSRGKKRAAAVVQEEELQEQKHKQQQELKSLLNGKNEQEKASDEEEEDDDDSDLDFDIVADEFDSEEEEDDDEALYEEDDEQDEDEEDDGQDEEEESGYSSSYRSSANNKNSKVHNESESGEDDFSEDEELNELLREEEDDEDEEDYEEDDEDDESGSPKYMGTDLPGVIPRLQLPEIEPVYESDTSDEENENTVGNIPMEWYDDYEHIGYDKDGKKIMKSEMGDALDQFLDKIDNPELWHSVYDKLHGKNVTLSPEDLKILKAIQEKRVANPEFNPYEDTVEWFTNETEVMPLSAAPEPKRRFIPSKWEAKRIMHIARAIRAGRISSEKPTAKPKHYDIWATEGEDHAGPMYMPAPKMPLPGNEESYNPPAEYLFTDEERKEWENTDPSDRKINFIPQKHPNLRSVPGYGNFIHERFARCLDLYLCPRTIKKRINIDPNSLLPTLPDPKDLEPFPKHLALTYKGHEGRVRSVSVDPTGQWLLTAGEDGTCRLWDVETGRCIKTWSFTEQSSDAKCTGVWWNPNKSIKCFAVAVQNEIHIIVPQLQSSSSAAPSQEKTVLEAIHSGLASSAAANTATNNACTWTRTPTGAKLTLAKPVQHLSWHRKGDYFSTVTNSGHTSILIHRLSAGATQTPFKKNRGLIQRVQFHPTKPFLFVATQTDVRVYNLQKQDLAKKLISGVKWISELGIHPSGDHVVAGSYDRRLVWWDLDLGEQPYKTFRSSETALRSLAFSASHPLLATATDSGELHLYHAQVHADMMTNATIVPVNIIKAHQPSGPLGIMAVEWHPKSPWCFTAGADGTVKLWC